MLDQYLYPRNIVKPTLTLELFRRERAISKFD